MAVLLVKVRWTDVTKGSNKRWIKEQRRLFLYHKTISYGHREHQFPSSLGLLLFQATALKLFGLRTPFPLKILGPQRAFLWITAIKIYHIRNKN